MAFDQRKLNEFLVDLVEFVQKHFRPPVTRTKILEEFGCAGVLMKHEPSGSEIEITTLRGKVVFRSGGKSWEVGPSGEGTPPVGASGPAADLYGAMIRELLAVFAGQRVGSWGGAVGASPTAGGASPTAGGASPTA